MEWEDEMFQRSEALRRKIDFERLRSMYECKEVWKHYLSLVLDIFNIRNIFLDIQNKSITNLKNLESTIKSSYKRKQQSKHIAKKEIEEGEIVEGSDDEDDESTDKDNDTILPPMTLTDVTQKSVDGEDGDDDDKLFDSDEEEEITRRVKEKEIVVLEQSVEVEDPHEDWDQTNTIASCDRLVEFGDDINIRNIKKSVQEDITLTQRPSKKPTTDATKPVFQSMAEYQHFLKQEKQKLEFLQYAADDKQPATLGDFSRITLRRDHLTSTANEPYFSDYVTGSYVKYLLNPTATGYYKPVYRLCQVMGVIELPVAYNVPCEHSQFFVTNIGLVLSTGDYQLDHKLSPQRMDQVSNHSVLDEELKYYLKSVTNYPPTSWIQAFPIPRPALPKPVRTKRDVRLLHEAQKKWKNHVYSNEEIEWMVKKKAQANAASKEVNKSTNDSNATTTKSFVQHDKRRENPAVVTKLKYLKMGSTTSRWAFLY